MFTGYNGASSIDTAMIISGTSLLQSVGGIGTGIEIAAPGVYLCGCFQFTTVARIFVYQSRRRLGDHNVN